MSSELRLFLYKDEKIDIGLLVWATCLTDAVDRVCFYLYTVKGIPASDISEKEIRKTIIRLRPPAKGTVLEEFKINIDL